MTKSIMKWDFKTYYISQSAHKQKKFWVPVKSLSIAVFYQGIKKKELKAVSSTLLQSID